MGYSWLQNWKVDLLRQLLRFLIQPKIEEGFQIEHLKPELKKQVELV